MDFNLVRLHWPVSRSVCHAVAAVLAGKRARLEQSLAHLCARELSNDPELLRRHQKPGLPFVLACADERLVTCHLLGPAIAELRPVVAALAAAAGESCPGRLTALDYQGEPHPVATDASSDLPVLSAAELLDLAAPRYCGCRQAQLELLSPLRLVGDGRELTRFGPERFIRTMLRRISSLAAYYGAAGDPEPFVRLADQAGTIRVVRMVSKGERDGCRGVVGSYLLSGDFAELGPLLELGSLLHLGKGAAFGNGRFRITPLS